MIEKIFKHKGDPLLCQGGHRMGSLAKDVRSGGTVRTTDITDWVPGIDTAKIKSGAMFPLCPTCGKSMSLR